MPHIAPPSIKYKKHLKQAIEDGNKNLWFEDPSMFEPKSLRLFDFPIGHTITCTNHPKRSWFAKIECTGICPRQYKVT